MNDKDNKVTDDTLLDLDPRSLEIKMQKQEAPKPEVAPAKVSEPKLKKPKQTKESTKPVEPKQTKKPTKTIEPKMSSEQKPENKKESNETQTEVITVKKESAWSKKWVRALVITISVIASIILIWLLYRVIFGNKTKDDNVDLDSNGVGLNDDFWSNIDEGKKENTLARVIPAYEDDAVIYFFENSGFTNNDEYNQAYIQAKNNANGVIGQKRGELKNDNGDNWEKAYYDFLRYNGYFGLTWQEMEQQWWNDLVATSITPIVIAPLSWQTYAKNPNVVDYNNPWCSDNASNDICFGVNDYSSTVKANETASELNKLIRSTFVAYLADYQPISISQVQIKFDFGEGYPGYSETMRIDAENIRHWWNVNEMLFASSSEDDDAHPNPTKLDFEQMATNFSSDDSSQYGGKMSLQPSRFNSLDVGLSMAIYAAICEQDAPLGTAGNINEMYIDWLHYEEREHLFISNEKIEFVINSALGIQYNGEESYDDQINDANQNNEIGNAIWARIDGNDERFAIYEYTDTVTTYQLAGADELSKTQTGLMDFWSTITRYGAHFFKLNGIYDMTDYDVQIEPIQFSEWYLNAQNGLYNDTTYFNERNINVPFGMSMELMREDLTAMAGDPTSQGVYGIANNYNTWLLENADKIIFRVELANQAFLDRNNILKDDSNYINDGKVSTLEIEWKIIKDRLETNLEATNIYFDKVEDWFTVENGYHKIDFEPLFDKMQRYMTGYWVDRIDDSEIWTIS